ncbi:hypothetical protein V1477_011235 [Vespula maculifrons]|uniref:Uncharacterized protein n=5 Tax=Vespula TaxID=7451 RepID=A0A834KPI7_VESGE|nr:hypothetical protein HZH66_003931 [Vespula vulgaris]KAF7409556.1 hypothetical protein HZH68_003937 [Vespula germanica]KAF7431857.1 hypothetical protein H0235_004781 [Vespula pensylvanica]
MGLESGFGLVDVLPVKAFIRYLLNVATGVVTVREWGINSAMVRREPKVRANDRTGPISENISSLLGLAGSDRGTCPISSKDKHNYFSLGRKLKG